MSCEERGFLDHNHSRKKKNPSITVTLSYGTHMVAIHTGNISVIDGSQHRSRIIVLRSVRVCTSLAAVGCGASSVITQASSFVERRRAMQGPAGTGAS